MYEFAIPGGRLSLNWSPDPVIAPAVRSAYSVYVEQAIHDSDPEADRTAAFNAVLSSVGGTGCGVVRFVGNHRILGDLYVPENVALVGPVRAAGQLVHLGMGAADYERKPGVLRLASTATIRVAASGYFGNAVVVRDGLNLPFENASEAMAGIAAFSGTAATMAGNDARVENALFLGFNYAIDSKNYSRLRFTDVQGDCINGIRVASCTDVPYMTRCHFWPFTTANYTWTASDTTQQILTRPGIGFELKNTVDWAKLTNCFTYGYFRGFRLADVHANLLTGCASDGPVLNGSPVVPGSIGVLLEGASLDNKLTDFTAAGKAQGLFLGTNSGCFTEVIGCNNVACDIGINVRDGDVQIIGGMDRVASIGLQVQSITSKVTVMRKMRQVAQLANLANPANVQIIGTLT
jgi:hypothetical protein